MVDNGKTIRPLMSLTQQELTAVQGWISIRKELRLPMFFFLLLSILYLGGWSVMFLSTTFRWTFVTWQFFSLMAASSVVLTLTSFVLGVFCRYNFGKGLPRYRKSPTHATISMLTYEPS